MRYIPSITAYLDRKLPREHAVNGIFSLEYLEQEGSDERYKVWWHVVKRSHGETEQPGVDAPVIETMGLRTQVGIRLPRIRAKKGQKFIDFVYKKCFRPEFGYNVKGFDNKVREAIEPRAACKYRYKVGPEEILRVYFFVWQLMDKEFQFSPNPKEIAEMKIVSSEDFLVILSNLIRQYTLEEPPGPRYDLEWLAKRVVNGATNQRWDFGPHQLDISKVKEMKVGTKEGAYAIIPSQNHNTTVTNPLANNLYKN